MDNFRKNRKVVTILYNEGILRVVHEAGGLTAPVRHQLLAMLHDSKRNGASPASGSRICEIERPPLSTLCLSESSYGILVHHPRNMVVRHHRRSRTCLEASRPFPINLENHFRRPASSGKAARTPVRFR